MRGYKNFEGTPHPGDLCHLVEIGYTENAINANGYPDPKDVVLCRVWASAVDAGNQHYSAGVLVVGFAVVIGIRAANAALSHAGEIAGRVLNDLRLIFAFQQRALPEAAHRHAAYLVSEHARGGFNFQLPFGRVYRVPRGGAHG